MLWAKGENVGYQHFFFIPKCNQTGLLFKGFFFGRKNIYLSDSVDPGSDWTFFAVWSSIYTVSTGSVSSTLQPFPKQDLVFTRLQYKSFKNTVGKGEIALKEQFLLFPQCFFYPFGEVSAIFIKFKIVVCKVFQFGWVWNSSFGEGLKCRLICVGFLSLVNPFSKHEPFIK